MSGPRALLQTPHSQDGLRGLTQGGRGPHTTSSPLPQLPKKFLQQLVLLANHYHALGPGLQEAINSGAVHPKSFVPTAPFLGAGAHTGQVVGRLVPLPSSQFG